MRKVLAAVRRQWAGYLSLFLVLAGGTAWAATQLERNEVRSKHIGRGQVKGADLANNAVTSPKVANGSLLNEDFAAGQIPQGPDAELQRFSFTSDGNPTSSPQRDERTVLTSGPLTLIASCAFGGPNSFTLKASSTTGGSVDASWVESNPPSTGATSHANGKALAGNEVFDVVSTNVALDDRRLVGTVIFDDNARTITIPFRVNVDDVGVRTDCLLAGTAIRVPR
jgi:hypothetical protein